MGLSWAYHDASVGAAEAEQLLRTAIDAGVDHFDTSDAYGFGENEKLVGRAIAASGRRDELVLATKAGLVGGEGEGSARYKYARNGRPEYIRDACDASLRRLGLETIDLLGERASSRRGPGQPDLGRHVEDEGQIRLRRVDDDSLEARQELRLEPAVAALVGARRIGEAVAEHEGAALERRADLRLEMVAPRRREQKRLGEPAERLCAAGQDGVADALGALRSAGLARRDDGDAARLKAACETVDLGRFPCPLPALEGDEAARHPPVVRLNARRTSPVPNSNSPSTARRCRSPWATSSPA